MLTQAIMMLMGYFMEEKLPELEKSIPYMGIYSFPSLNS
jgi:hypothetical protein